jgi:hypothetical protein
MIRPLSYFDNHSFNLIHLLFRFRIFSNNKSGNYTRPRVQPIVPVFDLGLLS